MIRSLILTSTVAQTQRHQNGGAHAHLQNHQLREQRFNFFKVALMCGAGAGKLDPLVYREPEYICGVPDSGRVSKTPNGSRLGYLALRRNVRKNPNIKQYGSLYVDSLMPLNT